MSFDIITCSHGDIGKDALDTGIIALFRFTVAVTMGNATQPRKISTHHRPFNAIGNHRFGSGKYGRKH
jgi:hypothetical protein